MNKVIVPRDLQLQTIRNALAQDASAFIQQENSYYEDELQAVADRIDSLKSEHCLVLLSGPSSSGKTTTAHKLEHELRLRGRDAHTISLDNFYRGYGLAPQLPDGSYDYECVEALDLPLLKQCMSELLTDGCTLLPTFDFITHSPKPERTQLCIDKGAVVIFEGIHALNPVLCEHLPPESTFKIFINVLSPIFNGTDKLLARRDLRLTRRLLRDFRFRNSSLENTMDMWRQVVRGENLYLFPYADTADITFDTTHAYEPAMLGSELLPLLREFPADNPYADTIKHLIDALSMFEPLSPQWLPQDALLREFVGNTCVM